MLWYGLAVSLAMVTRLMTRLQTDHGTCTIVFAVVGLAIFWILTLPRTLKNVAKLSIVCEL